MKRKCARKKDNMIESPVEQKATEILSKTDDGEIKFESPIELKINIPVVSQRLISAMDYSKKTRKELVALCKENGIKGYSGKKKDDINRLLTIPGAVINSIIESSTVTDETISTELGEASSASRELPRRGRGSAELAGCSADLSVQTTKAEVVREVGLDKFYTISVISEKCLASIGSRYKWSEWGMVIEPSAGNGSFLTRIPTDKKLGIDISPEHKDIIKQDFLTYRPPSNIGKILVVGNPPFGRVSSLAIKFFNHASNWADIIAFIIPRTFRRVSVHNKLNANFHLVFDEEIPMEPCSFYPPMMVKCCFQIWEKKDTKRTIVELSTTHDDWDFLGFGPKDPKGQPTPPKGADFAIRAYGGKCGEIINTGLETLRPKSWHWIKSKIDKKILMERFAALDYTISLDTARQNSIGRGDLVRLYSETYD
ncbi:MAG: hypothetical protein M0R33_14115 [Methylomonas sp.]|jgi:hypothetical protein|uniref:hypothetical protein n=1 Tax=Methylomonas sp. TaxID=418 RepID=UPI0025D22372|nr:hypothetical protein [Methylomonas sp.]MCK9607572.1 hypothetical protein [Methylomonas sp.]